MNRDYSGRTPKDLVPLTAPGNIRSKLQRAYNNLSSQKRTARLTAAALAAEKYSHDIAATDCHCAGGSESEHVGIGGSASVLYRSLRKPPVASIGSGRWDWLNISSRQQQHYRCLLYTSPSPRD